MPRPRRHRALSLLAFALVTPLLATGCGGEEAEKPAAKSPTEVMETAKKNFDDASSVQIALTTKSEPSGGNGVLGATGVLTHDPAFEGEVDMVLNSVTLTAPVTAVDGKVYAKLPFTSKYADFDPSEYGAPDPADFADPDNGLSGLLTKMEDLKKGKETRSSDMILTSYSGTLPGSAVKKIIPSAVAKESYATEVGVDEKGFARSVKVTGPFFAGDDDVTYNVKFSEYDKGAEITAPTG